jgi:glucose-6-phosphate dehydrogenase assembly protein OpcA
MLCWRARIGAGDYCDATEEAAENIAMSEPKKIINLGTPVQIDIAVIEQELRAFWKSASQPEGDGGVIRACSCNFVVFAQDREEAQAILPVLARVAEWHPSRAIIVYRESDEESVGHPPTPHVHAWISVQCSMPRSGGQHICSEAITLAARTNAITDQLNTLVSLLIPDLPVFLYWRSFLASDRELVERMARLAQLLIVDSHATKNDPENRARLLELLTALPDEIAVRDLNWARLTAWRDLVAQFFDPPDLRRQAYEIEELEISRDISGHGSIPTRTLLLTGWLASRLNWQRLSAERLGDHWTSRWRSRSGDVLVHFTGNLAESDEAPGISTIVLRTRSGLKFSAVREKGSSCITVVSSGESLSLVHSVPQESMDEATLLVRELSITGKDSGFQSALVEALALEKSFF